jgi:hypothetical protein
MVPVVDHRDRSHQPTGHLQERSHPAGDQRDEQVESVQIDQSIFGRMLDYGNVTILGTGEGFKTLRTIANPVDLRNSITGNEAQA